MSKPFNCAEYRRVALRVYAAEDELSEAIDKLHKMRNVCSDANDYNAYSQACLMLENIRQELMRYHFVVSEIS